MASSDQDESILIFGGKVSCADEGRMTTWYFFRWGDKMEQLLCFASRVLCSTVSYWKRKKNLYTLKMEVEHYQGYCAAWANCTFAKWMKTKYIFVATYHNGGWYFLPRCHRKQAELLTKWTAQTMTASQLVHRWWIIMQRNCLLNILVCWHGVLIQLH